jgi:4-amino-4-deoxy-L-arabinose transferase-like glycosyltransferase
MRTRAGRRQTGLCAQLATRSWPILAVVLVAFGLRLVNLSGRPLWYDEAFAVLYSEKPFETMLYGTAAQVGGAAADVHPLAFYSILHVWMRLAGQSPVAVRALSVLLGTATVMAVYLLARQLFDRRIGLAAAIVTAIAPFHIYYSQEARMYALLGLAAVTATFLFVRAWVTGRWFYWVGFAVLGAMTLYSHNLGFAFIAGLDVWVLWRWLRGEGTRYRHLRPLLLSHLLMLLLFAPWLAIVPAQFGKIQQAYWVERPGIASLIQTILAFHFAYDNQALPNWLLAPALFFSLLIPAIFLLEMALHRGSAAQESQRCAPYSLLLALVIVPVFLLFLVSQIRPVYIVRVLLPSALAYYVLASAALIGGTLPKPIRWGLLVPSGAIVVASLLNHYSYAEFPRPPFDQAAAYLRAHYSPGDVIVHSNKLTFLPMHYYDRALPQSFVRDEPGSPSDTLAVPTQQALGLFAAADVEDATQGHERVWFVIFRRELDEYLTAGYPDHPQHAWLEQHYTLVSLVSFSDLDIYEYQSALPPAVAGNGDIASPGEQ